MPSEIGFPMTLTSGAFVNKMRNKKPAMNYRTILIAAVLHFVHQVERQFKTSQDDTKLCQLQPSVSKLPDAA